MTITPDNVHEFTQGFNGTDAWYQHSLNARLVYSDGIRTLAQAAGAYWLIDLIASHQTRALDVACGGFQLWTLTREGKGFVITCQSDTGEVPVVMQRHEYTDFPLLDGDSIEMIVEGAYERQHLCFCSER